jgi:hypothetical protein
MNILKHTIKKFIYGTLPYYFMKGYKPGSPYLKYYEYIKEHGYSRHLYEFKDEYANMPVDIQKDEEKGLYYVQKEEKRLYFRKSTPARKIQKYYRALSMEQERHIVSLILFFRLYRSVRKFFSWEPHISRFLLKKEKRIYDTYLCKYDYCELLSADYQ